MLEAESALAILREDGSAVAFPEAVEQMREDMEQIVGATRPRQTSAISPRASKKTSSRRWRR